MCIRDSAGTVDNLLIDRMVCQDRQDGKRNVSMAWVDVRKAVRDARRTGTQEYRARVQAGED